MHSVFLVKIGCDNMIIEGAIIELFEEALSLQVSPNYRGRCGTTEERHAEGPIRRTIEGE
jgi:hypothetical protein